MKPQAKVALIPQRQLDLALIPYGSLTTTLPKIAKHLAIAAEVSGGRSCADDIVRLFYDGHYSLWVAFDKDSAEIVGFFAVEVKQYPQRRMLVIQHCVMEPGSLKELEPRMQELGARYGKDMGCAGIEFVGRPGWKRYSKKHRYHSQSVMYQQFFEVKEA